jgi:hypothetical protein
MKKRLFCLLKVRAVRLSATKKCVMNGCIIIFMVIAASSLLLISDSYAGSVTLYLENDNVGYDAINDNGGLWQHGSGFVYAAPTWEQPALAIATFAISRRINRWSGYETNPTITLTIIFPGESPPQNITLQGVQNMGWNQAGLLDFRGGVSAASAKYSKMVGASALSVGFMTITGYCTVLKIDYVGDIPAINLLLLD